MKHRNPICRLRSGVIAALLLSALLTGSLSADDPRPVRLLFAGSSSTYWNDLPAEVAHVVNRQMAGHRGQPVTAEIVGRSGSDIRVYLDLDCNYQYGVKPG